MKYYETLYIVHPALESGRLKDIILSLESSLEKLGGKTLSIDLWGKRRLAYLIDKQKYGTYVQFQFTGEGNCTSRLEMELEHNPNILSYLTTLIKETDVIEASKDLDTQIAGHSRESQRIDVPTSNLNKKNSSEDGRSEEKNEKSTLQSEVAENLEDSIEESAEIDEKKDTDIGDDVTNSSDSLEDPKTNGSEENVAETGTVNEEE